MNALSLIRERAAIALALKAMDEQRDSHTRRLEQINILLSVAPDINQDALRIAATVLYVEGDPRTNYTRLLAARQAAELLSAHEGGRQLQREYIGVKQYDRFEEQRSDHPYGMGPSHGSIVFRIGLTVAARERDRLDETEREAAVYALRCLAQGHLSAEHFAAIGDIIRQGES